METATIPDIPILIGRVGLPTWAIHVIDTAPVYGLGHSEEVVGRVAERGQRDRAVIAAEAGGLERPLQVSMTVPLVQT
jgi:hypothetical protein